MATIDNSPQYKELTTSNNGRNVRASLQAVSHFFLQDSTFSQTEADSFGAKSTTTFATTAKVSFSGTKKVYSICQGQVFIQPQTGSTDKVNVILKPYKQPINSIPIKYIIYRGLDKSDFFTAIQHEGNSRLQIAGSDSTGTGFVQYIWKEFNKFYTNASGSIPVFLEEFIGFPANANSQNLTDLIDQFFYRISQYDENTGEEIETTAFELPLIPRGIHIGNATGTIGIDIVLNNGEYYIENDPTPFRFDLNFARSAYYSLQTDAGNTNYENKLLKEIATQFMDIAALYGMHADGVGKLYVGEQTTPLTTKEDIYTTNAPFFTKNTVYLYIQSNRQRSYNFYGNYVLSDTNPNNLKIGASESTLTETAFGTNGWPVHKMNSATENIALALLTDSYENAATYAKLGFVVSEHEDNFIRGENLLIPKMIDDEENDTAIQYTKPITFSFPVSGQNTIASIVQLIHEGLEIWVEDTQSNESYYVKDIDDVFGLIDAQSITAVRSELELPTVVEQQLQLINFQNKLETNDIATVKCRRITDVISIGGQQYLGRVTYETLLDFIRQETGINLETSSSNSEMMATGAVSYQPDGLNNFYRPELPYYIQSESFLDSNSPIEGLRMFTTDLTVPSKKILGITAMENSQLLDLISQENLCNARIYFRHSLPSDTDAYLSPENISYKKYSLMLTAENLDGEFKLYAPPQEVFIFTIDESIFFSEQYSENMKSLEAPYSVNYQKPEV